MVVEAQGQENTREKQDWNLERNGGGAKGEEEDEQKEPGEWVMRDEMRRNTCTIPTVISVMQEVETEERRAQAREDLWEIPAMPVSGRRILLIDGFKK